MSEEAGTVDEAAVPIVPLMEADGDEGSSDVEVTLGEGEPVQADEGPAPEAVKGKQPPGWDPAVAALTRTVANLEKALKSSTNAPAAQRAAVQSEVRGEISKVEAMLQEQQADADIAPGHRAALSAMLKIVGTIADRVEATQAESTTFANTVREQRAWSEFDSTHADIPEARKLFDKHAAFVRSEMPNASPETLSASATALFKYEAQQIRATAKAKKNGASPSSTTRQTGRTAGPQNAGKPRPSGDPLEGFSKEDLALIGESV